MKKALSLAAGMCAALVLLGFLACGGGGNSGGAPVAGQKQPAPAAPDGLAVFRQNCVNCHGNDGKLGLNGAKDLTQSTLSLDERTLVITNGRNAMTPWKGLLSPDEIRAVAEHTRTLK